MCTWYGERRRIGHRLNFPFLREGEGEGEHDGRSLVVLLQYSLDSRHLLSL